MFPELLIGDPESGDLPPGVSISVTEVRIEPSAFAVAGAGCDESEPLCVGASFTTADDCAVPVVPTGKPGARGSLFLYGTVHCPPDHNDFCAGFAEANKGKQHAIELIVPKPSTPESPDPEPPPDSSPPDSSPPSDGPAPTEGSPSSPAGWVR